MTKPADGAGGRRFPVLQALLLALAAVPPALGAAQGPVEGGESSGSALPWVFVAFAVVALVLVILVFRWLRQPPERPPFNRPRS